MNITPDPFDINEAPNQPAVKEQARSLFVPAMFVSKHGLLRGIPMGVGAFAHPQEKGKGAFRGMLLGKTVPWGSLAGALAGGIGGGIGGHYLGSKIDSGGIGALAGSLTGAGIGGVLGGLGTKKVTDVALDQFIPYHTPELKVNAPEVETPKDPGALEAAINEILERKQMKQSSWAFQLGQDFSKYAS